MLLWVIRVGLLPNLATCWVGGTEGFCDCEVVVWGTGEVVGEEEEDCVVLPTFSSWMSAVLIPDIINYTWT